MNDALAPLHRLPVHDLAQDGHREEEVAQEVPVAVVVNGISHAVMLATPQDLEDFALGFALTEGLIGAPGELLDVQLEPGPEGVSLQLRVTAAREARLKERRRTLAGRTGCGLCGVESLHELQLDLGSPRPGVVTRVPQLPALQRAMQELAAAQVLNRRCGGLHAAAWCAADGAVRVAREDVGRHNAMDKVIGALQAQEQGRWRGAPPAGTGSSAGVEGFIAISSRASVELVHKATVAGAGLLASVSAPTALAVRLARQRGLALVSFVREGRATRYA